MKGWISTPKPLAGAPPASKPAQNLRSQPHGSRRALSLWCCEDPQRRTKAPPAGGLPGFPAYLFIYVEDVDTVIARAVEFGATLQRPAQDQFYGDRDGYIIDPFGHGWAVASHVEDVPREEMARRIAELYG